MFFTEALVASLIVIAVIVAIVSALNRRRVRGPLVIEVGDEIEFYPSVHTDNAVTRARVDGFEHGVVLADGSRRNMIIVTLPTAREDGTVALKHWQVRPERIVRIVPADPCPRCGQPRRAESEPMTYRGGERCR